MRRLDAEGRLKFERKHNDEVKVKRVMQNEQIDGLTTNHSLAPLPKQERMQALNIKGMESPSKIDL